MSRTAYFISLFLLIAIGLISFQFRLVESLFPESPYATLYFVLGYIAMAFLIQALRRKGAKGKYYFNVFSRKEMAEDLIGRFKGF